jgi:[NiFe] hydrogenase assembly HybE family chaperone
MSRPDLLEAAFRRIALTRMADMPLNNAALKVEAVGFRPWQGSSVGLLITPWCINLILLSDVPAAKLAAGERREVGFPSGVYEFMGGEAPECGPYQFCSLFSPPDEFADHAQARDVCLAVMARLFEPEQSVSRRSLFVPPTVTHVVTESCTK